MGRYLRMVCIGGPFGLLMGMFLAIMMGNALGIVFGLVVGLSFWLFVEGFVTLHGLDYRGTNPCHDGERVFQQGPARHFAAKSSFNGWLFLTNGRLLFRSLRFETDGHERSIPLEDIVEIQPFPVLWVMSNGLLVVTTVGEERFGVADNAAWVAIISRVKIGLATAIWDSVEAGPHKMSPGESEAPNKDDRIAEQPAKASETANWQQIKTWTGDRSK